MPTDDERREVARRMRDAMRSKCDFCAHNVAIEMGMADPPDYDGPFNAYHMLAWKSLADLIDPDTDGRDALLALAVECKLVSSVYRAIAPEAEDKELQELFSELAERELKISNAITKALEGEKW